MQHHPPLVLVTAPFVLLLVLPLASSTPPAAIHGRWVGEMRLPNSHAPLPLLLKLNETDGRVDGTGGPNDDTQYPLEDVACADGHLHAVIRAPGADEDTFVLDLDVDGDTLVGRVTLQNRHGMWRGRAELARRAVGTRTDPAGWYGHAHSCGHASGCGHASWCGQADGCGHASWSGQADWCGHAGHCGHADGPRRAGRHHAHGEGHGRR
ncbi:MAG: hypothetical protein KJ066_11520 [Acidobacteria bacterium]|nr:hypothetical protein [Acidobacteriota bacterium]